MDNSVAMSRVKSIDGLKVLILNKDKEATNVTTNVLNDFWLVLPGFL